jgi:excisionase family DNA binding protein
MFFGRLKTDISKDGRMESGGVLPYTASPDLGGGTELMDDVRMMRPAEAADALGVSLARLRRLAACGRLVTVRTLGGHRRYREDDVLALQRWLQSRRAIGA